jgi:hypothetical protein
MKSISTHPSPLQTLEELTALSGVGVKIAAQLATCMSSSSSSSSSGGGGGSDGGGGGGGSGYDQSAQEEWMEVDEPTVQAVSATAQDMPMDTNVRSGTAVSNVRSGYNPEKGKVSLPSYILLYCYGAITTTTTTTTTC